MIDCPKCSFNQPEDRYCANCGVDMHAYKKPVPPLAARLAASWIFQVSAVATIVALVAVVQYRDALQGRPANDSAPAAAPAPPSATAESAARSKSEKLAAPTHESANSARGGESEIEDSDSGEFAKAESQSGAPTQDAPAAAAPTAATLGASAAPGAPGAPATAPKAIRVTIGEFRRGFIAELAALARDDGSLNTSGNYSAGGATLTDASARLTREAAAATSSSNEPLAAGQSISMFKGVRDANSRNVGITIVATAGTVDENGAALAVELIRSMRESPAGAVVEQSFQENFTLKAQRIAFMAGLIPHRAPDATERELYASTPLAVMASPSFQSGATEFAVLISLAPPP